MSNVGLDAADIERVFSRTTFPEYLANGLHLNRITRRRTSSYLCPVSTTDMNNEAGGWFTVGLDVTRQVQGQPGLLIHMPDQVFLCVLTGLRHDGRLSILVGTSGSNDRADRIAISNRIAYWFKYDGKDAFSSGITICAMIKTVAYPIR